MALTVLCVPYSPDSGSARTWVSGLGFQVSGLGSRVSGFGFRVSGLSGTGAPGGKLEASGAAFEQTRNIYDGQGQILALSGYPLVDSGFRAENFGFLRWVSGFGFRGSDLRLRVLGFGFWDKSFRFLGCRGSGFGLARASVSGREVGGDHCW